jgi:hypothetical protein
MAKGLHPVGKLAGLGVFGASMAYLEAAVVVYLRRLYYPEGFSFPMKLADPFVAKVEIGREIATILMLLGLAFLSETGAVRRFLAFAFAFGIWDILYYAWLKLLLNWPAGWLDWDVLFLVPVPWFGPWIAPALIALVLSAASGALLFMRGEIGFPDIILAGLGALACLFSFTFDGFRLLPGGAEAIRNFVPERFLWEFYLPGLLLIVASGGIAIWRNARR